MPLSFPVASYDTALDALLDRALAEDLGTGDISSLSTISEGRQASAYFLLKEDGVVAGLAVAERVFARVDPALVVTWTASDGEPLTAGTRFGTVEGPARSLLSAERLALNLMQRMSGIATASRRIAEAAAPAKVLDTRKTVPGLRLLDKEAVRLGGAHNHRIGLYDMVMIKDNHIAAAGGLAKAVRATRRYLDENGLDVPVEVETRTMDEVDELLAVADEGGVDRVLLDNMARPTPNGVDVSMLRQAVERIGGRIQTEASGNVTLETAGAIGATGVDYVSVGALTHSVRALDISLKVSV